MVNTETIELDVTESHADRLREIEDELDDEDMEVRSQLANLVMQSIDDTYREL